MEVDDFIKYIESNDVLTGKFEFPRNENLMGLDFVNKTFVDFELKGGDFASGAFINCTFDRVLFEDLALVAVNFTNCHFVNCKLSQIESSFGLDNCRVDSFVVVYVLPQDEASQAILDALEKVKK